MNDAGGDSTDMDDDQALVSSQQSIARMPEGRSLAPDQLRERGLIHPGLRNYRQLDLFRELRANVLHGSARRNPVILVTGVSAGCGTSFLARNLAVSIAFDEARTSILMDCNLRRPAVASDFSLADNSSGLMDLFGNNNQNVASIIHQSGVPRLRLIPAGRGALNGVEYFASVRMRALIQEVRSRYEDRCLVIDAPPALGSPDARILAEQADLVVIVAGEGRHRAETIRRATRVFPRERLAGVVFNHLP
ncbi:MAG: tyrosine-protein kinase family protein [Wenzhouxiangella sp.]